MKKLLKKIHIYNKKKSEYIFLLIIFVVTIIILSGTFTGSIFCDKEENICSVKSPIDNKETNFRYSDVTTASCDYQRSGRDSSYDLFVNTAEHRYKTVNVRNTTKSKEFSTYVYNKYLVAHFRYGQECNMAVSRFKKYQKSTKNQFSEHERNYIYFAYLIIIFIIYMFRDWSEKNKREEKLDRILSNEKELKRLFNETKKNKNTDDKSA